MIKAVANKRLDLSTSEFSYYQALVEKYGKDHFKDLFETNHNGHIISVQPPLDGSTPMAVIFFMLNVMFTQRMRTIDEKLAAIENFEKKVATAAGPIIINEEGRDDKKN